MSLQLARVNKQNHENAKPSVIILQFIKKQTKRPPPHNKGIIFVRLSAKNNPIPSLF